MLNSCGYNYIFTNFRDSYSFTVLDAFKEVMGILRK